MAVFSKGMKGYVKTESVIMIVLIGVALGFVGGVVFSAYRSSGQFAASSTVGNPALPMNAQQREQLSILINRTTADPEDFNAWSQLGHFYFDTSQHALAIDAYQTALALEADHPDVWTDMGVMFRRNGEPQKAIQSFDQALAIDQRHEIALFNKGVVLMHDLDEPKEALASWEKLLAINPQFRTPGGQTVHDFVDQLKKNPGM